MLIYSENSSAPSSGASHYKSTRRRNQASIRVKTTKRTRRTKRRRSTRRKKLSVKNKKFLRTLGYRLKR